MKILVPVKSGPPYMDTTSFCSSLHPQRLPQRLEYAKYTRMGAECPNDPLNE